MKAPNYFGGIDCDSHQVSLVILDDKGCYVTGLEVVATPISDWRSRIMRLGEELNRQLKTMPMKGATVGIESALVGPNKNTTMMLVSMGAMASWIVKDHGAIIVPVYPVTWQRAILGHISKGKEEIKQWALQTVPGTDLEHPSHYYDATAIAWYARMKANETKSTAKPAKRRTRGS